MSKTLLVIVASTRPGRIGRPFGDWMVNYAREHSDFEVGMADLAEIDLPLMDEPNHPRLGQYTHDHTKAWSKTVAGADAFVIVMPEYNHSYNAALKNALDYLSAEWKGKPVGFLSYGGVAGGIRAVESIIPVITVLGMVTPVPAIVVPFAPKYIGDDGAVVLPEEISAAGTPMLDELAHLSDLLSAQDVNPPQSV